MDISDFHNEFLFYINAFKEFLNILELSNFQKYADRLLINTIGVNEHEFIQIEIDEKLI